MKRYCFQTSIDLLQQLHTFWKLMSMYILTYYQMLMIETLKYEGWEEDKLLH